MGSVALKKVALLLMIFLISAPLVLTSFAGTTRTAEAAAAAKGMPDEPTQGEEYAEAHDRSLSARTNDYANYDPPPTFPKPPPKPIPN